MKRYMISDAANLVNVESYVLRYWEDELGLDVPRNEMGHRYYTEENIAQFMKIKELKEQGYQLKSIRPLVHDNVRKFPEPEVENKRPAFLSMPVDKSTLRDNVEDKVEEVNVVEVKSVDKSPEKSEHVDNNANNIERFKKLMIDIMKEAMAESNEELGKQVIEEVSNKVLKEMNYLMRVQDDQADERYRKLDELIRAYQKKKHFKRNKVQKGKLNTYNYSE